MNTSPAVKLRRPPKGLRDQARREQIVNAARHCVIRYGFHAASMAEIAAEARMSVGQIYRYFPNKEAIVHAIVERIVAQRTQTMMTVPEGPDFPARLAERLIRGVHDENHNDHILMLEVTAEATRNPAVAEIVRQADQRLHQLAVAQFLQHHRGMSQQEAAARVELIAVLFEGTIFRRVTGQRAAEAALSELYRDLIARLYSGNT